VDPALWELLRAEAGTDGDRVLEAVIRLARPGIEIPDVRIVSRFGTIATCRIRARDVIAVRARRDVISIKAARGLSPGSGPPDPSTPDLPAMRATDVRRSPSLALTGAGVVVASVDWGMDLDSAAFRWPTAPAETDRRHKAGGTRFLAFWDQRDQAPGPRPAPYGYGTVHEREEIDLALQGPRPYEQLGYHPAIADRKGRGAHGTHVLDIAAGNGRAGGPMGIAPDADLMAVHLADRSTGGLGNLGDSVRLLEAIDWLSRRAGSQPCVVNISAGRICGPKDSTTLVERAFDELLATTPGRFVVNSAGNYFRWRTHSCGALAPGEKRVLTVVVDPADITLNEVEVWYDGADEFTVRVDPAGYAASRPVRLGERADLSIAGRAVGRVYHRKHDPNNGDNHIVAYLDPVGCPGNWTVTIEARRVTSGRFHAWIERDDSCPGCQARFSVADSNPATTIGTITTSHLPLIVGAYNGHDPARPAAPFSSRGPSRDGRRKPDLAAPGVDVLAARSAAMGTSRSAGLLVRKSGTSMATPHVTGAVALCLQAVGHRLSAREIRSLVLGSCDPVPDSDPYRFGHGYLNIPHLVAEAQRALAAPAAATGAKEPIMDAEDTITMLATAPATAYREYLYCPQGRLARWISDRFDVVARPGQPIRQTLREGDVLLEVTLGRLRLGRCVTLGTDDLSRVSSQRQLPHGQLLLRPRRRVETSEPLPVEPVIDTQDFQGSDPGQSRSGILDLWQPESPGQPNRWITDDAGERAAEHDFGEDGADGDEADSTGSVLVDTAAAVPPFSPTERATVVEPLLSARESAKAIAWSQRMHPGVSGVSLREIREALKNYIDPAAVQVAIEQHNKRESGDPIDASSPDTEAVLAECVHQFQKKCYCEQREHDGHAGESTLDSLGLIVRAGSGFRGADRGNATAQKRLNKHDQQVQAATSHEFSAANWFSEMTDPTVFGWRTKSGHGLHVLLVRKLRQAERYLLTLPAFRGKTPAALGKALGLNEPHGGARPAARTGSVHTFGLAIDIGYTANPWLHDLTSWHALHRAATLVSGIKLANKSAPDYFSSLGADPARSTGQVWDELSRRSAELIAYFKLGDDVAALRAALMAGQVRGTADPVDPGESMDQAVARWRAQIRNDRGDLARNDFLHHEPPGRGFLTLPRDLVIALRERSCLAWGAVDFGPTDSGSGDVMHFDARIDGAGYALARGTNYVPKTGHPCLHVSSSPTTTAPGPGQGEAAVSDYLDGKLWTFTAKTLSLPVAVFCPKAALQRDQVEVLVFAHGLLRGSGRPRKVPAGFITDAPFAFGPIVHASGRPIVLAVPHLDWANPGGAEAFGERHRSWHALGCPDHLNSLISEIMAQLGHVAQSAAPSVSNLIIAGHSRAYDFLEPLAYHRRDRAMHQGGLANLSEVWAFDTTYSGEVENWIDWMALNPHLRIHIFYNSGPGSGTARAGDEFYRVRQPRLTVTRLSERHLAIPASQLPALLVPGPHGPAEETVEEGGPIAEFSADYEALEAGDGVTPGAGEALTDSEVEAAAVPEGLGPEWQAVAAEGSGAPAQLTPEQLTARIARCVGIWETNRGKDNPAPKESTLDTVAGVHASMATIEQATMPYAITALKGNKALRDKANPPLTMTELNSADARVTAVATLLSSVTAASAQGNKPDDFIAASHASVNAAGLSDNDVRTMFRAVTLKASLDKARTDAGAAAQAAKQKAVQENKTEKEQASAAETARQHAVKASIDAIPAADRLGLGEGSLRAYINKPGNWGENRAGWQRKAVDNMPDKVGNRIEAVAVSDNGTALAIPTFHSRVDTELAKMLAASAENIVKSVAQKNNPHEANYGLHVWETYQRLYP
jgi:subtilisin family serine protease